MEFDETERRESDFTVHGKGALTTINSGIKYNMLDFDYDFHQ